MILRLKRSEARNDTSTVIEAIARLQPRIAEAARLTAIRPHGRAARRSRAASIVALSASRLVWPAMLLIESDDIADLLRPMRGLPDFFPRLIGVPDGLAGDAGGFAELPGLFRRPTRSVPLPPP